MSHKTNRIQAQNKAAEGAQRPGCTRVTGTCRPDPLRLFTVRNVRLQSHSQPVVGPPCFCAPLCLASAAAACPWWCVPASLHACCSLWVPWLAAAQCRRPAVVSPPLAAGCLASAEPQGSVPRAAGPPHRLACALGDGAGAARCAHAGSAFSPRTHGLHSRWHGRRGHRRFTRRRP